MTSRVIARDVTRTRSLGGAAIEPVLRGGTADKIVRRHSLDRLNASMIEQKKLSSSVES